MKRSAAWWTTPRPPWGGGTLLRGWFMAVLYTPCLVSALAWISARYFCVLLGWDITGGACMTIAGAMLCLDHVLNALHPGWQAGSRCPPLSSR